MHPAEQLVCPGPSTDYCRKKHRLERPAQDIHSVGATHVDGSHSKQTPLVTSWKRFSTKRSQHQAKKKRVVGHPPFQGLGQLPEGAGVPETNFLGVSFGAGVAWRGSRIYPQPPKGGLADPPTLLSPPFWENSSKNCA